VIGQTVSHYRILEHLGGGGMGVVYKAQDLKLDRLVALKFLPSELLPSAEETARFHQEAKAISSLNHPHIATLHDVDEAEGRMFLVLEYIPGSTLKSKVKELQSRDRELPLADALKYGVQIAEGLAHAHRHGIIHRDIKTDNMMLTEEGDVKISDFGLAKLRGVPSLTQTGSTLGTVAYMSPEQIQGEAVDARSDLFSLGVVLYELLTGRLPFQGEHEAAVTYSIVNTDPIPVRSLRAGIPEPLEAVIHRCLEKERQRRFQTAGEIADELRRIQPELPAAEQTGRKGKIRWAAAALLVVLLLVAAYILLPLRPAPEPAKSIAVLPFLNMSGDKEDEYFSDGMTEQLIHALSKIEGLHVAARTSSFAFKGKTDNIKSIGRQLDVGTLLEGSVRKAGDRIRITAQLINVADGFHIWSETYDRDMHDVFAAQDEISRAIVSAFRFTLGGAQEARLSRHSTENTEAFELYLKGRYYTEKRTEDGVRKGIEYFEKALEKDPQYALAHVGLADCWVIVGWYYWVPPKEAGPRANAAANRSLEIDSSLAEAHTSLAHVREVFNWDWSGAEAEYKRALELNPSYSTAHHWYSLCLVALGRMDEAVEEARRAQKLDPLSLIINENLGDVLSLAHRYDEAIEQLRRTLELDSSFTVAHWSLARAYCGRGMYNDAISDYLHSSPPEWVVPLKQACAAAGIRGLWEKELQLTLERSAKAHLWPNNLARLYALLGKRDEAFTWLERGYDERTLNFTYLRGGFWFDSLRSDPRYTALLRKAGLEK
jgi:TolB-like protein